MLWADIAKVLQRIMYGTAAVLLVPLVLAGYYEYFTPPETHPQPHTTLAFLITFIFSIALAIVLGILGKNATGHIYRKEGLFTVVMIWLILPFIAAIPFYISGTLKNPYMAYFETVSGMTTTGASVMEAKKFDPATGKEIKIEKVFTGVIDTTYSFYGTIEPVRDPVTKQIVAEGIEAVSRALLFWRSFVNWLGGIGIVVLMIAVLPTLGAGGKILFQMEATGPIKDTMTPRLKETGITLCKVYALITTIGVILLMATNSEMPFFDALTISFSGIATGGFSIKNTSIGFYDNVYTEYVTIFIMVMGSLNFGLFVYMLKGQFYRLFQAEFILYILILIASCMLGTYYLYGQPYVLFEGNPEGTFSFSQALRYASFQISSMLTTTGFFTANYDNWPYVIQSLMIIVMFLGGMTGSTAGGLKTLRLYMLFRIAQDRVESLFRPQTIQKFKLGDKEVIDDVTKNVLCFFLMLISVSVAGTFFYVLDNVDPQTAIGLVACMINNVGLAFRVGGPLDSCAFLSDFGINLSSLLMLMGRFEFFAFFALLVPAFWKQTE